MAMEDNIYIPESAIITYGILREGHLEKVNEDFKKFKTLSDQKVFAETLLIENKLYDHTHFISKYPNIFTTDKQTKYYQLEKPVS